MKLLLPLIFALTVFAAQAEEIDQASIPSVKMTVRSSDGVPMQGFVVEAMMQSQHWGPYKSSWEYFPSRVGWHLAQDYQRTYLTNASGVAVVPEVRGNYRQPYYMVNLTGVWLDGCGQNGKPGMAPIFDPATGYWNVPDASKPNGIIDITDGCHMNTQDNFSADIDCRLQLNKAQLDEMMAKAKKGCEWRPGK